MSLSAALHATVATLRRRPDDLLPFYMLGAAVPAVARLGTFLGLGAALGYLHTTGRLQRSLSALAGRELNPPDPQAQPEAFADWMEGILPVVEPLVHPVAIGLVAAGLLLTVVLAVVLGAVVSAGQIAACSARLRGERGLTAGIAGVSRYWRPFLAAYLAEAAVWFLATAVTLVVVAAVGIVSPIAAVIVGLFVFLGWLLVVLTTRAVFAFVPVAIVVDDVGLRAAIRGSLGFVRRHPGAAIGYYAIAVGSLFAVGTAIGVLSLVQAQAIAAPAVYLLVTPALELVKTGLFATTRAPLAPPSAPVGSIRERIDLGFRRGLRAVARFLRDAPELVGLALALGLTGGWMGWLAAGPFVGSVEASIVERLADHLPPIATLQFFGNNWTVALTMAFSGTALVVPAALGLWFNGVVLGVFTRLETSQETLVAFVLPHGIVEIPSLLVAGALGGYLGLAVFRTWRGRASHAALADALERAFWIVVGLGVLLAVAALIEGFVSPYYWRPFL